MTAAAKYLGGVNLPIGTIKQVPTSPFTPTPETIAYNGLWIRPGAVYLQSAYPQLYYTLGLINAASFTPRTSGTASGINAVTYGSNVYAYGGAGGATGTSTDAVTWTARTSGSYAINGLTYGSNVFVRVGATGYTGYSTDAVTWTEYAVTNRNTNSIATTLNANLYVAAGTTIIRTSTDLHTWTVPTYPLSSTAYFNGSAYNPTANGVYNAQEVEYYTSGSVLGVYSWTVPDGVTAISAVCVGGGGGGVNSTSGGAGGNGADLRWSSNIAVSPGQTLLIVAGSGGVVGTTTGGDGNPSQIFANIASYSGYFDGNGDYLSLPSTSATLVGSGNFTTEMWVYLTSLPGNQSLYSQQNTNVTGSASLSYVIGVDSAGRMTVVLAQSTSRYDFSSANNVLSTNQWYHVALVRNGNVFTLYVNGTSVATNTAAITLNSPANDYIGVYINIGAGDYQYTNGYISNFRIVKGTAVYTGNFTPPAAPLTNIANTSLLTCQSSTFIDNSTNNFTITVNGDTKTSMLNPFSSILLSAAGGGGGTTAGVVPRSQSGNSSIITGNIGGGSGGVRANNTTATSSAGGGGAGGYSGAGGAPGVNATPGTAGTGGAGGGGGGAASGGVGGAGGGVALTGQGASGAGGASATAGSPGSLGAAVYCGAGGGGADAASGATAGTSGGVRIIWGAGRSYPNTNTAPTLNSRYSIVGDSGYAVASAEGTTWIAANTATATVLNAVTYGNGTWVGVGTGGVISYSNNGSQWNTLPAADYYTSAINSTLYGGNLYLFSGTNILKTTTDLKSWSTANVTGIASASLNGSAYNANTTGTVTPQQIEFYTPGTYSWTVPAGVGTISAVTVGGGGGGVNNTSGGAGGNGADLRYSSGITVTEGEILTIVVGAGGHTAYAAPGIPGIPSQIWRGNSTGNSVYVAVDDYYTVVDNANLSLQMRTGNYTMEGWWYPTVLQGFQTLFDKGGQGIGGILIQTGNGNGNIQVYSSNVANTVANITANLSVTTNAWNHIAVVRDGTTVTLYQNGNSVGSATMAANCNSTATFSMCATAAGANGATGYFSNFRVVKGNAVYTSNFVPPTTQLTAVANTSLLTFQNANIQDNSTNNFFIGAEGNVRTTTLSPFGNLTLLLSAAGGGGGTVAVQSPLLQNGLSSAISGNIGGGNGGIRTANTTTANTSGGGGAGGYSGAGGVPGVGLAGANAAGGGGGGGGGGGAASTGGQGGGVGLMGARANGTGGALNTAGSPGSIGAAVYCGGGGPGSDSGTVSVSTAGQDGGVRIIWGAGRTYPSTNTGPVYESKYIAVGDSGYIAASADGNSWIVADSKTITAINATTYGNGVYVYGGAGGLLASSTDGSNWTARTSNTSSAINALTYGAGVYVYGGAGGVLYSSTDATTWTVRTSATTSIINGLTYGNGLFVYGTTAGGIGTSTDAVTWTARTSGTSSRIMSVAYGNGVYVYVGTGGVTASSTDAITWTARRSGTTSQLNSVTYGNGLFVASGTGGTQAHRYSTDGVTWFSYTSGTSSAISCITYGNGLFVFGSLNADVGTSTDGVAWVMQNSSTTSAIRGMTYGNGLYVFTGNNGIIFASTDAVTWVARTNVTNSTLYGLAYGAGVYVYGGASGVIGSSTDTITWTLRYTDTVNNYFAASYGNGLFFVAGGGGSEFYRYSTDGTEWFSYTSGTTSGLNSLTYGNGTFVAGGVNGVLRTSTNGDRWVVVNSGTTNNIQSLAYGNGVYLFAGDTGMLYTSANGNTWTTRTTVSNSTIYAITYGNGVYVYGGWAGSLASSTDAVTWTARTSGTASTIYSLTYGNSVYIYGGVGGVLASSTDAVTWGDRKSGTTQNLTAGAALSSGVSIFGGSAGFLGTSGNLAINQYSTAYNAATEFYVPAVTATSFGTLQANVSYLVGVTQSIYIKARQ